MKFGAALVLAGAVVLAQAAPAAAQARLDPNLPAEALETIKMLTKDPEVIAAFEDLMVGVGHLQKAEYPAAETVFKKSITVLEKHFPDTPYPGMVNGLLATVYISMGDPARAEPRVEMFVRSARMEKMTVRLNGMVHELPIEEELRNFTLGMALGLKGMMLERRGDYAAAEAVGRESLALWRKQFPRDKFPNGHFMTIGVLANLAKVAALRGDYDTAERYANEAVTDLKPFFEMKPVPGIDMAAAAAAMANLAAVKRARGGAENIRVAEDLEANARAIYEKLFPPGHPHLATLSHNSATSHLVRGDFDGASRLLAEARDILEKKFPDGHQDLCQAIRDQGYVRANARDYAAAERFSRDAIAMADRLFPRDRFPDGHPIAADCLNQLGFLALRAGSNDEAARHFREAANITAKHTTAQSQLLSETDVLNLLRRHLPDSLSGLLTATAAGPFDPRDYRFVWASKAASMRALELRHRALLASRDPAAQKLADELELVRAELSARLLAPAKPGAPADPELAALANRKDDIERRLNELLGLAAPGRVAPHPFDIAAALPAKSAFVDFVRYNRAAGAGVPGLTDPPGEAHYAAFVLAPGRRPERVELGPAKDIDEAIETWRRTIATPGANERWAAGEVDRVFWKVVAAKLPADLESLYLAPDAALNRVPFAALPGRTKEVLLEEAAVAVVPHGQFLLDRLKNPPAPRPGRGRFVVAGGVDYGKAPDGTEKPYPALKHAAAEVEALAASARDAGAEVRKVVGADATTTGVLDALAGARVAHVATHGFFLADEKAQTAFGLAPAAFRPSPRDLRTPGARNPLVLSGLALAGANRIGAGAAPDRGVLTAEVIAGRRFGEMDLAVLSACETGLGTEVGGEGVFGLQRAFHLAGCRTVVASLWTVDDDATRELMTAFYKKLWDGATPAQALRAAQLELLRVSRERGLARKPLVVASPFAPPASVPAPAPGSRFDAGTYFWAAFVVSGAP